MAKRPKELTVYRMISFNGPNGDYKPWEACTPEEIALFRKKVGEKLSKVAENIILRRLRNGESTDIFGDSLISQDTEQTKSGPANADHSQEKGNGIDVFDAVVQ